MNQQLKKADPAPQRSRLADEAETAQYIADLVAQLERIARGHGLVKLQYLLKTCQEEAERIATGAAG